MATAGTLIRSLSQPHTQHMMEHQNKMAFVPLKLLFLSQFHHTKDRAGMGSHLSKRTVQTMAEGAYTDTSSTATSQPYNSWPTSPPTHSSPVPDTTSPVYPSRAIRPLPKRKIRDRINSVSNIEFPPAPESSSPIFAYPYVEESSYRLKEEEADPHRRLRAHNGSCLDCGHDHSDGELGSEEEIDDGDREVAMGFSPDSLQMVRRSGTVPLVH